MNKYFLVAKNTWDEVFTYRLNFVMWRIRVVLQLLTVYFLWFALIPPGKELFGYSQTLMLTYILGTFILTAVILSSRTQEIGENINSGNLSIFLIRPINYFLYWFAKDLGDKGMNIVFSIAEILILFTLLAPPFFVQTDTVYLLLTIFTVFLALLLNFFIGSLLGLIGFWSSEVWAPRFIFYILVSFFAGGLFPLDILPKSLFDVSLLLPFSYMLYFPLKIYLGQLSNSAIYSGILISFIWIILLYVLLKIVWSRGLKAYTAQGR